MKPAAKANQIKKNLKSYVTLGTAMLILGCNSAADIQASLESATSEAFPSQLAVTSPFASEETTSLNAGLYRMLSSPSASYVRSYVAGTTRIDEILTGATPSLCTFRPEDFLVQEVDASCYGPTVQYQEHPEGSAGNFGELPSGDVGLWQENDAVTGRPCAAEEYDARMQGVSDESMASLMGLASMICVFNTNGYALPSSSVQDVTAEMNDLAISGVLFSNATLEHALDGSGNDQYSYNLEFSYTTGSDTYEIVVDMNHAPTGSATQYEGRMSYRISGANAFGGNCPETDATVNASLQYSRTAADALTVEVREGRFCGANAEGRDASGIVDPSLKYPAAANGWSDDFNILTASYDPSTLDGNYAYVWQAGSNDGNTRVFNLRIESDATGNTQTGYTFFGYGDDVETTDGSIGGFICNWAGPCNNHDFEEFAQYQEIEYDVASNTFTIAASSLAYAPTTTCDYDGSGSFIYDSNGDDDLSDESHVAVTNELAPGQDLNGDSSVTIEEVIADSGFTLPSF